MRYYTRKHRPRRVSHPRGRLDRCRPHGDTAPVPKRDPKRLGVAIKAIRTELGLSRRAFAERGDGLGAKTVQRLEEGTIDPWPQTLLKFDKAAGKPAGWSDAVIEGKIMYPDEPDPSGQDDPEPLSPDWWLTLRRALTAKMFAEVSELVHLGQKAAAEGDQSADGA